MSSPNLIDIQADLSEARRVLAQRVAEVRAARQQVRDAEVQVVLARRVVKRYATRKRRAVTGKH